MEISRNPKVAIVGSEGIVGSAYQQLFPDAVRYDEPKEVYIQNDLPLASKEAGRLAVNASDLAIVSVFTPSKPNGELDTSIVEEVVDWIETPLILIKSALQPGTVDKLLQKHPDKQIAVSVEFIGEGNYPVHFWKYPDQHDPRKHSMLIVGGEEKTATKCAEILWRKMSPDINIHLTSAREAEITKLWENTYGGIKVTLMNTLMSLTEGAEANFIRIHQAWQSDPRTDSMHLRAVSFDRGWTSKCWDKDIPALRAYAEQVGADDMVKLLDVILELNQEHLKFNDNSER
jgi:UDP-glucose 6-dehydrogenase